MSAALGADDHGGLAARLVRVLRRLGWKGFIARCYRRAASLLVRFNSDIVLSKDLAESGDASRGTLLQVSAFDAGDPAMLDRIPQAWCADRRDIELLRICAKCGYAVLFAEVDGSIVGHMWWTDRSHPHLARYGIRLGPREAYAFHFFLELEHRGGGNANEFLSKFEQHLRSRGFERVWGFVESANKPARWLYSLCGWRPSRVVDSVEIARCLLFSQIGLFVRDSRRRNATAHDYRRVASWRGP